MQSVIQMLPKLEHLDDWQKKIIAHRGDMLIVCGRQIGKTMTLAIKSALRMREKANTKIIISSLTEDQAKLIISMILIYLEQIDKKVIAKGSKKPTQNKVTLKNGSYALARPVGNTGDAIRGFTGDILIIDEASRFPELAFTAGEPVLLSTGGEVWMASTPFGRKGYFYEQYASAVGESDEENLMGWMVMHVNGEEALKNRKISESWPEEQKERSLKRLERLRARWGSLRYRQEILAEFVDDLRQLFPDELIRKVQTLKRPQVRDRNKVYVMGCDIARLGGDQSTFEVFYKSKGKLFHVENIAKDKILTTETEDTIIYLTKLWNLAAIGIDAGSGSLGVSVYDHLKKPIGRRLIAMNNRQLVMDREGKKKQRMLGEDMYYNLLGMMERGEIELLDDADVFQSLKSVQYEYKVNDVGVGQMYIFGQFTHIAEGIKFAAWISKEKNLFIGADYI